MYLFSIQVSNSNVVGSPGGNDPDNRRMFQDKNLDENQLALREDVSKMIKNRRSSMPLIYGSTKIERADENVLIIRREYLSREEWVVFNKGNEGISVDLGNPGKGWTLFESEMDQVDDSYVLELGPMSVEFVKFVR